MAFFFEVDRGNPMTISIEIEFHFQVGISNVHNSPTGCWCSSLTFWQIRHLSMDSAISSSYYSTKSIAIGLYTSWCLLDALSIECSQPPLRSSSLILHFFDTHRWFWNCKIASSCSTNPGDFLLSRFFFILWSSRSFSWFTQISSIAEGCKVLSIKHLLACVTLIEHPSPQVLLKVSWMILGLQVPLS